MYHDMLLCVRHVGSNVWRKYTCQEAIMKGSLWSDVVSFTVNWSIGLPRSPLRLGFLEVH